MIWLLATFVVGYLLGIQTVSWWMTSDPQRAIELINEHTNPSMNTGDFEIYFEKVGNKFHAYQVADHKFLKQGISLESILDELIAENPETVFSIKE